MASSKYVITMEWENGKSLEMRSKKDADAAILIIRTEENNHFVDTRVQVEQICDTYFSRVVKAICDEMIK